MADLFQSQCILAGPERLELASSTDSDEVGDEDDDEEDKEDATFFPRTQASSPFQEQNLHKDLAQPESSERKAEDDDSSSLEKNAMVFKPL